MLKVYLIKGGRVGDDRHHWLLSSVTETYPGNKFHYQLVGSGAQENMWMFLGITRD